MSEMPQDWLTDEQWTVMIAYQIGGVEQRSNIGPEQFFMGGENVTSLMFQIMRRRHDWVMHQTTPIVWNEKYAVTVGYEKDPPRKSWWLRVIDWINERLEGY